MIERVLANAGSLSVELHISSAALDVLVVAQYIPLLGLVTAMDKNTAVHFNLSYLNSPLTNIVGFMDVLVVGRNNALYGIQIKYLRDSLQKEEGRIY